jgi:hypothetical protein
VVVFAVLLRGRLLVTVGLRGLLVAVSTSWGRLLIPSVARLLGPVYSQLCVQGSSTQTGKLSRTDNRRVVHPGCRRHHRSSSGIPTLLRTRSAVGEEKTSVLRRASQPPRISSQGRVQRLGDEGIEAMLR